MAKVKVVFNDGHEVEGEITPAVEYAFEVSRGKGLFKAMREDEKQSDVYWLAWEVCRRSGESVKPFGLDFLETVKKVDISESDPLG